MGALIGFLSGVLVYPALPHEWLFLGVFAGVSFVAFAVCFFLRRPRWLLVGLAVAALSLGLLRARASEHVVREGDIDRHVGQAAAFEGLVIDVDARRDHIKYTVEARTYAGRVLVTADKVPAYRYGDVLRIEGDLEEPSEDEDFSYKNYLSRYGIYALMRRPQVEVLQTGQGNAFWAAMYGLRDGFMARIGRLFPEPGGSFMAGLLIGARKGIPEHFTEAFTVVGLSHIVAISGSNIAIIIAFVMWFLKRLPRRLVFWVASAAIVLFTLFVGASPAVTRAAIMGILSLLALHHGRQNNVHLTVLFTAFFMVAWNPKIMWWDAGFQLSFLAVLGLIYVAPHFERFSQKLPEAFAIREAITMTLAAQVMAAPLIAYQFGRFSLIAPLANLLVTFMIPAAMFLGFMALVLSFVWIPLGIIAAWPGAMVLRYILKTSEVLALVPYASVDTPLQSFVWVGLYYVALALWLFRYSSKTRASEV